MNSLWNEWDGFKVLVGDRDIALFLDYDGTLTPIVRRPSLAKLSPARKEFLGVLARSQRIKTAIISGRPLSEVKALVGIPGFIYAGNHGLEFEGPKIRFVYPGALGVHKLLKELAKKLARVLEPFPGIFVEDKGLTLSVHYRELSEEQVNQAREIFSKAVKPYAIMKRLMTTEGKKVWEVRPLSQWNKGTLVLWLLGRILVKTSRPVIPIYIGDDQTDEDAFKALKGKGVGIKVTEHSKSVSKASYFLDSPPEVYVFLKRLLELKNNRKKTYASARNS